MLLKFLCHRDAHLDFGETAQNDPMVKGLQISFLGKLQLCQQIKAWIRVYGSRARDRMDRFFSLAISVPK